MIIAIAGPIGVGKSTVARELAARLGYRYISGGEVFRALARARGVSVTEVNKLAEQDPALDRELDDRQRELAKAGECVVESRLAGWMVDADLKIWLRAPLEIRASRVAQREHQSVETAQAELVERERSEWARYSQHYHIDLMDLSPYQVIIDTRYWEAEAIARTLADLIQSMQKWDERQRTRDPLKANRAGRR